MRKEYMLVSAIQCLSVNVRVSLRTSPTLSLLSVTRANNPGLEGQNLSQFRGRCMRPVLVRAQKSGLSHQRDSDSSSSTGSC